MSFIESLQHKPKPVRKLFAFMVSGVIAVLVAGFAIYSLFANINNLGKENENAKQGVIIEEESIFQKLKGVFGLAKSEIATSTSDIKEIFKNVNAATSTATSTPEDLATSTASSTNPSVNGTSTKPAVKATSSPKTTGNSN